MVEWCDNNDIPVHQVDLELFTLRKPWRYLLARRQTQKLFIDEKIELIHSNQIWSYRPISSVVKTLRLASVCHLRDPVGADCHWWLNSNVNVVICISQHIEQQFLDNNALVNYNEVATVINPIANTPSLNPEEIISLKNKARTQFELHKQAFIIGFIGQIIPLKGLPDLIRALAAVNDDRWQLLVAGVDPRVGGCHVDECKELSIKLGVEDRIHFLGYLENATLFYEAIDLVVVPSIEEPLGRVPLEAAGHYKPSIVSDAGGLPETVKHNETGWIVKTDTVGSLTSTVIEAMDADLIEMGVAARAWKELVADPTRYMHTLKELYLTALNTNEI